jgi:hypothetical protein
MQLYLSFTLAEGVSKKLEAPPLGLVRALPAILLLCKFREKRDFRARHC